MSVCFLLLVSWVDFAVMASPLHAVSPTSTNKNPDGLGHLFISLQNHFIYCFSPPLNSVRANVFVNWFIAISPAAKRGPDLLCVLRKYLFKKGPVAGKKGCHCHTWALRTRIGIPIEIPMIHRDTSFFFYSAQFSKSLPASSKPQA